MTIKNWFVSEEKLLEGIFHEEVGKLYTTTSAIHAFINAREALEKAGLTEEAAKIEAVLKGFIAKHFG